MDAGRTCEAVERVLVALEAHGCHPKSEGSGYKARCPAHEDKNPSLSISEGKERRALIRCQTGCKAASVVAALDLTMADLFERTNGHKGKREEATYDYTDENGELLFKIIRFVPKSFSQRRLNADRDWTWGITAGWYEQRSGSSCWHKVKDSRGKGNRPHDKARWIEAARRVLYNLPKVIATGRGGGTVYVTEGEKDADVINALPDAGNFIATTNPGGAGKWRPEYSESLRGASVVIVQDKDGMEKNYAGEKHARTVYESLKGIAASVKIVEAKDGKDAADHLKAGFTLADFVLVDERAPLVKDPVPGELEAPGVSAPADGATANSDPVPLSDVVAVFQKWLYLPDPASLYAILATIVANRMPGDPIWLLMVAGSSWGKSEQLSAVAKLPDVFPAATITEAALLSGTANRNKAKDAKGGLLRTIGESGILLCKDFGSILNMNRDARAAVLAALREIYDGSWTRHLGTDGGKSLHWSGKVGFLGGCTPTIDRHHAVMSAMGERFILFRIPENDGDDEKLADRALTHEGKEAAMRREMSDAVARFLAGLRIDTTTPELDAHERKRLIDLASLVVRCRSAVERDGYSRQIELVVGAEAPGRLVVILSKLLDAFSRIGLDRLEAWRVVKKMAFDSIPGLRRKIIRILTRADAEMITSEVAQKAQYPINTTYRQLEELAAYGVIRCQGNGQGTTGRWSLTPWAKTKLEATSPEMLGTMREGQDGEKAVENVLVSPARTQTDFSGEVVPCEPPSHDNPCEIGEPDPRDPFVTPETALSRESP